jgi:molybdenum cofactor synthesis domain-containing protein
MEYRLLEKTELWVGPLTLEGADLGACAKAVSRVMGLGADEVMVTDALGDHLTFDVLVPTLQAEQFVARRDELLAALGSVEGVLLNKKTGIHSEGILGLISLDEENAQEMLQRSADMGAEISERIKKRAMILATGPEVIKGDIVDTNSPFLAQALAAQGYEVDLGGALADDKGAIARGMGRAAEDAYGLVVTSGGVGAEGKDQTLEALTSLDREAATPYVLKFKKGQGRHAKDGVRLGAGRLGQCLIVCLPGPHDEVQLLWPILQEGLAGDWDAQRLAHSLAQGLREKFLAKSGQPHKRHAEQLWEEIHGTE